MDALEIIRQLEGDAGLRAQMRAVLLGDELLELPDLVRRLAEAQVRTEDRLRQFQEATERRFDALEGDVGGLRDDVDGLKGDVGGLRDDVDGLRGDVGGLRDDVGGLKGRSLEDRLRVEPRRYVPTELARRARPMPADVLDQLLDRLSPEDGDELLRADALIEARLAGGTDVVFVAEAAWTAHVDDVERAARRSEILRTAGIDARPLVVSQRTPAPAVLEWGRSLGVAVVDEGRGLVPPAA